MYDSVLRFAQSRLTAVISWLSAEGNPQSATIFYWIADLTDTGFTLYFCTRRSTRKFVGITRDPRVAVVIGTEFEPRTLQCEGHCRVVKTDNNLKDFKRSLEKYLAPPTQALLYGNSFFQGRARGTDFAIMRMTPTWARFMDYDRDSSEVVYQQIIGGGIGDVPPDDVVKPPKKKKAHTRKRP